MKKIILYAGLGAIALAASIATYLYVFVPYEERQKKLNRIMIFRKRS